MNSNRPPFIPPPRGRSCPRLDGDAAPDVAPDVAPDAAPDAAPPRYRRTAPRAGLHQDHMLRAHLYLSEALRFSASQGISAEVSQKVRQAKEQLLCEDDFQEALTLDGGLKYEVMKLLASTRDTWKAIDASGLDMEMGTVPS